MFTTLKIGLIHIGGTLISLITLLWMPWRVRVWWAKVVYKLTYVNPAKHPTYMSFIEQSNAKYQMGKRAKGMYKEIDTIRRKHEKTVMSNQGI